MLSTPPDGEVQPAPYTRGGVGGNIPTITKKGLEEDLTPFLPKPSPIVWAHPSYKVECATSPEAALPQDYTTINITYIENNVVAGPTSAPGKPRQIPGPAGH